MNRWLQTFMSGVVIVLLLVTMVCKKEKVAIPAPALLTPDPAELAAAAPEKFQIKFETSQGDFVIEVYRDWSPHGADRLYYLAKHHFYDGVRFFRVIDGFMAQFGYHGDPAVSRVWMAKPIPDDPVKQSNLRGFVTFAKSALPNSRTTQLFINYGDNSRLDPMGFAPVGKVIAGMEVVDRLYSGYGEGAPSGP
ncbi:MAG: peptidylprolyl isomerase, partial [candidate division KSB1 bacterium]|nr:peptidylprolyl isomerase [candidate division KSB1 bacterium]